MGLAAALSVAPTPLFAEAQVQGSPEAVRIETQNSSIEEVLTALGNTFELRYRSSANLAKQLSGTYEGSLQRVVARVLEGYDFVLRNNKGKIEITVLGTRNASPGAAVASSASNPAKPAAAPSGAHPPAAARSKTTEQPASAPPPSPPSSAATKDAEAPLPFSETAKFAEMGTVAGPMPGPMLGPAPIPEKPGEAAVPVPTPMSGPAPFPEPMPITVPIPVPETNPESIAVPLPGPVVAPAPTNGESKSPRG
jgi:hypothetical protein